MFEIPLDVFQFIVRKVFFFFNGNMLFFKAQFFRVNLPLPYKGFSLTIFSQNSYQQMFISLIAIREYQSFKKPMLLKKSDEKRYD
jgi:hypothetical protein